MEVDNALVQPAQLYTPQALLDWLDKNAIGRGWVSVPPFVYRQQLDRAAAAKWASYLNDGLLDLCNAHASRLSPVFHLPVEHPALAAEIASHWTAKGQHRFAMPAGAGQDVMLSDSAYEPLWKTLDAASAFLLLHPQDSTDARHGPFYLKNLFGNPYETAVAAAHLTFSRVPERFPQIKICLAHGGGLTAIVAGRFDRGLVTKRPGVEPTMTPPSQIMARLYADSILHDPNALTLAGQVFGASHILFGSDWPYPMGLPDPHAQLANVDAAFRAKILSNADAV